MNQPHQNMDHQTADIRPRPTQLRISLDANVATPTLAGWIGQLLRNSGAEVICDDLRVDLDAKLPESLKGLMVCIDRMTWVRDQESERWFPNHKPLPIP